MSLRDALLTFSDVLNNLIQSLLDLPFWLWAFAFVAVWVLNRIFDCVQARISKKRESELNRINLSKE